MSYILVVDDDTTVADTIARMVNHLGWRTTISNGPNADMKAIHTQTPALILLDMNLPGLSGLEVCRYIKRDPLAADTPVVFVSVEDSPVTVQAALEAGAADYLVKPVDVDQLDNVIKRLAR